MNRPEKTIYFMIVQDVEDGYAYGGFESLNSAISHLPLDIPSHIEMTTTINEVVDLNNPCDTCKYGKNKTVLRCRECESPWWKNHELRDLFKEEDTSKEEEIRKLCKDLEWEEVVHILFGVLVNVNDREVYDNFKMAVEAYKNNKVVKEENTNECKDV